MYLCMYVCIYVCMRACDCEHGRADNLAPDPNEWVVPSNGRLGFRTFRTCASACSLRLVRTRTHETCCFARWRGFAQSWFDRVAAVMLSVAMAVLSANEKPLRLVLQASAGAVKCFLNEFSCIVGTCPCCGNSKMGVACIRLCGRFDRQHCSMCSKCCDCCSLTDGKCTNVPAPSTIDVAVG